MKYFGWWIMMGLAAAWVPAVLAQGEETNLTVITSEKLTFDYQKHFALFEKDVVVTDQQLNILCDKLTVHFESDNKPKQIKAEGHVRLVQDDKSASSDEAVYDVLTGKIELTGNPQVVRGTDVLSGQLITFWRDQNKMEVTGGSRLLINSMDKDVQGKMMGGAGGGR